MMAGAVKAKPVTRRLDIDLLDGNKHRMIMHVTYRTMSGEIVRSLALFDYRNPNAMWSRIIGGTPERQLLGRILSVSTA